MIKEPGQVWVAHNPIRPDPFDWWAQVDCIHGSQLKMVAIHHFVEKGEQGEFVWCILGGAKSLLSIWSLNIVALPAMQFFDPISCSFHFFFTSPFWLDLPPSAGTLIQSRKMSTVKVRRTAYGHYFLLEKGIRMKERVGRLWCHWFLLLDFEHFILFKCFRLNWSSLFFHFSFSFFSGIIAWHLGMWWTGPDLYDMNLA